MASLRGEKKGNHEPESKKCKVGKMKKNRPRGLVRLPPDRQGKEHAGEKIKTWRKFPLARNLERKKCREKSILGVTPVKRERSKTNGKGERAFKSPFRPTGGFISQ